MQKQEFMAKLHEVLELDDDITLTEETNLLELQAYDSMALLSVIALIDECFDKRLMAKHFQSITTVKSLLDLIGEEHFA